MCVASSCTEGQYWCQDENTCKPAGQACSKQCLAQSTDASWVHFNNPSPSNINSPSAPSIGSAVGYLQVGTKTVQVNYVGEVRSV